MGVVAVPAEQPMYIGGEAMGKRANGEGSVYRRKSDGRWVGSLTLPDGTRKVFYGKKQSEVVAKIDKTLHDLRRGMFVVGSDVTLQQYLENWLEEVHKPTLRLSTLLSYRDILRKHIIP